MELFGLGMPEIILILVIFLIFFGKDKLPDFARSLGRSVKELKSGFETSISDKDTTSSKTSVKTAKDDTKKGSK